MQALSVFHPFVLPEVQGVSVPLANQKILQACIDFCARSQYWQYTHAAVDLVADQKTYSLTVIPTGSQIETIIDPLYYNGNKIFQKTKAWADNYRENWETDQGMTPEFYIVTSPGVIRPAPYPDAALTGGIPEVTLALKPLPTATQVEDFLYNEFHEEIAAGAKAKLMEMPNKDWTDTTMAGFYETKFENAITRARRKVKSGYNMDQRYRRSRAHYF